MIDWLRKRCDCLPCRRRVALDRQIREIRNALAARKSLDYTARIRNDPEYRRLRNELSGGRATQELIDFMSGLQAGFAQADRARRKRWPIGRRLRHWLRPA